jgi:hypothetical protein
MRLLEKLFNFYHVAGGGKGHLAQGKAPLFLDNLQHGVYVGIVQDEKAFWIGDGV